MTSPYDVVLLDDRAQLLHDGAPEMVTHGVGQLIVVVACLAGVWGTTVSNVANDP